MRAIEAGREGGGDARRSARAGARVRAGRGDRRAAHRRTAHPGPCQRIARVAAEELGPVPHSEAVRARRRALRRARRRCMADTPRAAAELAPRLEETLDASSPPDDDALERIWFDDSLVARLARVSRSRRRRWLYVVDRARCAARCTTADVLARAPRRRARARRSAICRSAERERRRSPRGRRARLRDAGAQPAVLLRGYGGDEPLVHATLNPDIPVVADAGSRARCAQGARSGRGLRDPRRWLPASPPRAHRGLGARVGGAAARTTRAASRGPAGASRRARFARATSRSSRARARRSRSPARSLHDSPRVMRASRLRGRASRAERRGRCARRHDAIGLERLRGAARRSPSRRSAHRTRSSRSSRALGVADVRRASVFADHHAFHGSGRRAHRACSAARRRRGVHAQGRREARAAVASRRRCPCGMFRSGPRSSAASSCSMPRSRRSCRPARASPQPPAPPADSTRMATDLRFAVRAESSIPTRTGSSTRRIRSRR